MSFSCETIQLPKEVTFFEETDFIHVRNTEIPEELPIPAKLWTNSYCFPEKFANFTSKIAEFAVRPDDIWLVTFPKCGTTWSQEMLWQLSSNLNLNTTQYLHDRFPFLEMGCLWKSSDVKTLENADQKSSPRFIKTHLPAPLLPKQIWTVKPRIIYVARNVKDCLISFYHHYRHIFKFSGNLSQFVDLFLNSQVMGTPYDSHVLSFWSLRHKENILFLTYEDMKRDHPSVIRKTAEFLGKSFTDEQIETLAEHLSFDKFSKNTYVNFDEGLQLMQQQRNISLGGDFRFVRKGQVNAYKDEMSSDLIGKIDSWLEHRLGDWKDDPEIHKIVLN